MYQALYRKYRPVNFSSVVGQDAIIKTLKNSIIHHNFSHAYMFFGSRGTGKTSVSKIFARAINCLNPQNGEACGKCESCNVSFSKECVDIIEIDAASNNGVDEIRELKNNVNLVPTNLKFKVYIIDEVHMLSDSAFNALLKTLEEPPHHAVFILATTDPQKVPETIVSRCQCFSFKRISDDVIFNRLHFICEEEKINIEEDVLKKISILSDGGLRDAIGSLDKLLSYSDDKISLNDFYELNGVISDEDISNFVSCVFKGNISDVILNISSFNNSGKNLIQILIQIIDYCRNIIVSYYLNHLNLDYPIHFYENYLFFLNEKMLDIKKSGNTKVYFEILILKYINEYVLNDGNNHSKVDSLSHNGDISNVDSNHSSELHPVSDNDNNNNNNNINNNNINNNNNNINNLMVVDKNIKETNIDDQDDQNILSHNDYVSNILNIDEILNVRINNTFATADKKLLKLEMNNFDLLKDYSFDQEIGYIVNSLLDSKLRVVGKNDLIISYDSDALVQQNLVNFIKINEVYNKITNSNKNIAIVSDSKWNELKNQYIDNLKNHFNYKIMEEPPVLFEENEKDDIIVSSAISLFGDEIVEVE